MIRHSPDEAQPSSPGPGLPPSGLPRHFSVLEITTARPLRFPLSHCPAKESAAHIDAHGDCDEPGPPDHLGRIR
jgi:hypothetical protein